jgi:DNA-binding beta-propeller fold protein YncE
MKWTIRDLFFFVLVAAFGPVFLSAEPIPAYHVVKQIPVAGDGGWDYLTLDAQARRLYISHSTQVDILDVDQEKIVEKIADTPGVHGIALAPDLGRGFTSNGKDGTVTIFDLKSGKTLDRVKIMGENPDAIVYDPATHRVFTMNGRSSNVTALDAVSGKVLGQMALPGRPEFAAGDGQGTVYVDIEDKSLLVSLDAKTLSLKASWPLAPCEEPSALTIDVEHRRLFAGCHNRMMVVVDAADGHVITTQPIGDHVDADVFNPVTQEIFSSNGDGTLTVIHEDSPDAYHVVGNVKTQVGARTVALDTKTNRLFLADAQFGPAPAATPDHPHPRPAILPGTFTILVVAHP